MAERIRAASPVKLASHVCSDDTWQELLRVMNSNEDEVTVRKATLEDAQLCESAHSEMRGEPAFKFVPTTIGRTKIDIERKQVWDFVQCHHHKAGAK